MAQRRRLVATIKGLTYRNATGRIVHNPEREILDDMDKLPLGARRSTSATSTMEKYFGGYLQAPLYVAVHRPRLQIALHLLPVAADRGRSQLPHHVRPPAWSRR